MLKLNQLLHLQNLHRNNIMKCICGYEKLGSGYVLVPAREELYQYGRNKGKVKHVIPESQQ